MGTVIAVPPIVSTNKSSATATNIAGNRININLILAEDSDELSMVGLATTNVTNGLSLTLTIAPSPPAHSLITGGGVDRATIKVSHQQH